MKWLVWASLGGVLWAQGLPLKIVTEPPDARVTIVGVGAMKDRDLAYKGHTYTLPLAILDARGEPSQLRFSLAGHADQFRTLDRRELEALPQDPEQAGVHLFPIVSLVPNSGLGVAVFLSSHRYGLGSLALLALLGAVVALRKYAGSRKISQRLDKIDEVSRSQRGDPMIGRRLDTYLITHRLGSGGMATVYRGIPYDSLDESQAVALKIIQEERRDEEFFQRFRREVEVTRSLNHPNTLRLFGWGDHEGLFFLIMELVDGKPLQAPAGGFSMAQFQALMPGLMGGLIYAHQRGIVHRDLKPDNLMLMNNGQIKVMDFGLARSHEMKTVTATGTALGTPAYMAPEQILGSSPSPSSDQYSLGVTFYEMLCGRRPFDQTDLMALIQAHLHEEPMPPSMYRNDLSLDLEQVVMRMLCKQPERRFADLQEVHQALLEAFSESRP